MSRTAATERRAAGRQYGMELIRISDSKLKVMLNAEDMAHYKLSCETIDTADSPSRRGFWSILDEAKRQTGFDPAGERVFVQLYPEKSGGCEMFVTKLGIRAAARAGEETDARTRYRVYPPLREPRERVYRFNALSDLLAACRRMKDAEGSGSASAYVNETKDAFYLVLERDVPFLSEYNAVPGGRKDLYYIEEHCRCFSRDAVCALGDLA